MLYLSAIVLAFFLTILLISKRNKSAGDRILFAWLATTGFHLLTFYMSSTGQWEQYPALVTLGFPLPLAQGPFLYLYTRQQTSSGPFNKSLLLHFAPILLSYLLFADFYTLSHTEQVEVYRQKGHPFENALFINLMAIYASGVIYTALSLFRLLKHRRNIVNQFSNTEKINFNWLLYQILWIILVWIFVLLGADDKWIFGAASLFVLWLGYFGIKQGRVFHQVQPDLNLTETAGVDDNQESSIRMENSLAPKYQRSSLLEEDARHIHSRLKSLMAEEKPYRNPELTLNELAKALEIHPNHLSQVINSMENKSFYDMVNELRVKEFIAEMSEASNQQYTLLGLAYDCGFNSKASFNRNFKKCTGQTPSDYLKDKR